MRLFSWFSRSEKRSSIENPNTSISDPKVIEGILGGNPSDTGVVISKESALAYSSVFQAVNLISSDVAKLPVHLFERMPDGSRQRDRDHHADWIVNGKANPYQTANIFKKTLTAHALLHGNGYAYIFRD